MYVRLTRRKCGALHAHRNFSPCFACLRLLGRFESLSKLLEAPYRVTEDVTEERVGGARDGGGQALGRTGMEGRGKGEKRNKKIQACTEIERRITERKKSRLEGRQTCQMAKRVDMEIEMSQTAKSTKIRHTLRNG